MVSGVDSNSNNYSASYQATRDANDQITRAQDAVKNAQKDADIALDNVRESFDKEATRESSRNEGSLAKQQMKGYEQIRDLKRAQQAELSRVHRDGERDLKNINDFYRDSIYETTKKSDADLRQLQSKDAREHEFVQDTGLSQLSLEKADQTRKVEDLKHSQEEQFQELSGAAKAEYDQMKTHMLTAREEESKKFQANFQASFEDDQKSLGLMQHKANQQLRQLRQDTAQKLAAYSSRQNDPFYKMMDLKANLQDEGDRYVLTANIPTHEQDHVSAVVHGNTLTISGTRRNEEKLDLGPGRSKGSSSYQTYEESFPLPASVDKNLLTKEFNGDTVTITVPKSTVQSYLPHKAAPPERLRAERPQFPENLPHPDHVVKVVDDEKPPSGRTLT